MRRAKTRNTRCTLLFSLVLTACALRQPVRFLRPGRSQQVGPLGLSETARSTACPMNWLVPQYVSESMEFLPNLNFSECSHDHSKLIPRAISRVHSERATSFQVNAPFSQPKSATIGKMANLALRYFAHASFSGQHRPGTMFAVSEISANESIWARHVNCLPGVDAWTCLFGRLLELSNVETPSDSTSYEDSDLLIARRIWDNRFEHLDDSLLFIIVGWISKLVIPLNSCGNFRRCDDKMRVIDVLNLRESHNPKVYLSLHVRMGDSCDERVSAPLPFTGDIWTTRKRKCVIPAGYAPVIRKMKLKYNVTDILLATDSTEVIDWAITTLRDVDLHYLDIDRTNFEHGKGWIETRSDVGYLETESALHDMELLSQGHVFIGGLGSHFSRAILLLMSGNRNTLVPFISVDGCSLRNSRATDRNSTKSLFAESFERVAEICTSMCAKQVDSGCCVLSPDGFLST